MAASLANRTDSLWQECNRKPSVGQDMNNGYVATSGCKVAALCVCVCVSLKEV